MSVLFQCINHHHKNKPFHYMDHVAKDGVWERDDGSLEMYYNMGKDASQKLLKELCNSITLKNDANEVDETHYIGLQLTYIFDTNGDYVESYMQGIYEYDGCVENGQIEDILFDDLALRELAEKDYKEYYSEREKE